MSEHSTATSPLRSQLSSGITRYWCHQCGNENPIYMAPDPTCQRCNSQFIEEIDGGDDPRTFLAGATLDADDNDNDLDDLAWGDDMFQSFRRAYRNDAGGGGGTSSRIRVSLDTLAQPDNDDDEGDAPMDAMLQNILSNLLTSGIGNDQDDDSDGDGQRRRRLQSQRRTPMVFYRSMIDGNMQVTPLDLVNNNSGEGRRRHTFMANDGDVGAQGDNGGNRRQGTDNNLQGILQLISALTGAPMVGNPNDYVSSQAALDNIITQLMEQTGSGSAPPPAPEDVISGLPKRPVSEQEFKDQVDCAVCKDEFNISELVNELPCQHLFHDDCIKPWLKVNGTCPVCRHSVVPSSSANQVNDTSETSSDQRDPTRSTDHDSDEGSFVLDSGLVNRQYARRRASSSSSSSATQGSQQQQHPPITQQRTTSTTGPAAAPVFPWLPRPSSSSLWSTNLPGTFPWSSGDNTLRSSRARSTQQDHPNTDPVDMDIDLD